MKKKELELFQDLIPINQFPNEGVPYKKIVHLEIFNFLPVKIASIMKYLSLHAQTASSFDFNWIQANPGMECKTISRPFLDPWNWDTLKENIQILKNNLITDWLCNSGLYCPKSREVDIKLSEVWEKLTSWNRPDNTYRGRMVKVKEMFCSQAATTKGHFHKSLEKSVSKGNLLIRNKTSLVFQRSITKHFEFQPIV